MSEATKIQWTDHTFNPWIGCTKVSDGCRNCYAEALMDKRWGKVEWGPRGERKRTSAANWREPLKWNRQAKAKGERARVFCASLADVFEPRDELDPWREDLFNLIYETPWLDWQILTKRPGFAADWLGGTSGAGLATFAETFPNVWMGTSVEDQTTADERIARLLDIPAAVRFLSVEPLLGPIDIISVIANEAHDEDWEEAHNWGGECELCGGEGVREYLDAEDEWGEDCPSEPNHLITCRGCESLAREKRIRVAQRVARNLWVIIGGESGPGARPCGLLHIRSLLTQCRLLEAPAFVKQLGYASIGGRGPHGPELLGQYYDSAAYYRSGGKGWHGAIPRLRDSKGGDPAEWPADLRVRQFPEVA